PRTWTRSWPHSHSSLRASAKGWNSPLRQASTRKTSRSVAPAGISRSRVPAPSPARYGGYATICRFRRSRHSHWCTLGEDRLWQAKSVDDLGSDGARLRVPLPQPVVLGEHVVEWRHAGRVSANVTRLLEHARRHQVIPRPRAARQVEQPLLHEDSLAILHELVERDLA